MLQSPQKNTTRSLPTSFRTLVRRYFISSFNPKRVLRSVLVNTPPNGLKARMFVTAPRVLPMYLYIFVCLCLWQVYKAFCKTLRLLVGQGGAHILLLGTCLSPKGHSLRTYAYSSVLSEVVSFSSSY